MFTIFPIKYPDIPKSIVKDIAKCNNLVAFLAEENNVSIGYILAETEQIDVIKIIEVNLYGPNGYDRVILDAMLKAVVSYAKNMGAAMIRFQPNSLIEKFSSTGLISSDCIEVSKFSFSCRG